MNRSQSLVNQTLAPGWCSEEVEVLKVALMKFGIGQWKAIMKSQCLPGKTSSQLSSQTQRLLGQQSLAEYLHLHLDIDKVAAYNQGRTDVKRKSNCIVNTGNNPDVQTLKNLRQFNAERFALSKAEVRKLKLPHVSALTRLLAIQTDPLTKLGQLHELQEKLEGLLQACRTKSQRPKASIKVSRQHTIRTPRRSSKTKTVSAFVDPSAFQEGSNANISDPKKTPEEINQIRTALSSNFVFDGFEPEALTRLIDCMRLFSIKAKQTVVEQFQPALNFYILATGKLIATNSQSGPRHLVPGDIFGELALLHDSPRTETVKTLKDSTLWALEGHKFREILESVNARTYGENREFLEKVPLFQRLTAEQKDNLMSCLHTLNFRSGAQIVHEGDNGYEFYIIKSGEVACTESGVEVRRLRPGQYFGEQALLHGGVRIMSATAVSPTVCLSITRDDLLPVFGSELQLIIFRNTLEIALERHSHLGKLSSDQRNALIKAVDYANYSIRDSVEAVDQLVIVLKGALMTESGKVFGCYSVLGCGFFESEEEEARSAEKVECKTADVDVAYISKERFEAVLGGNFQRAAQNNLIIKTLKHLPIFHKLTYEQLRDLSQSMQVRTYQDGDSLIAVGAALSEVFFLQSGKVDVLRDNQVIRTFHRGSPVGEQCLERNFTVSQVKAVANGAVTAWSFPKAMLQAVLDSNIESEVHDRALLLGAPFSLDSLQLVKPLGKGLIGNVHLVYEPTEKRYFALKYVLKSRAVQLDLVKALVQERRILMNLDHHMVMKAYGTYRDTKRVYFLMEFVHSESFFSLMRRHDLLSEEQARFYTAACIEVLSHLHERDIVHRDIKPENLLIDDTGYPKLIDFSTSKIVQGRTYTVIGTPYYMAPEVIKGKGYGASADLWSLGIMLFEMVCGCVPFGEEEGDPIAIYQKVLEHCIVYPESLSVSKPFMSLINQLLHVNSAVRAAGCLSNLKSHGFFADFSWELLRSRDLVPPLQPVLPDLSLDSPVSGEAFDSVLSQQESEDIAWSRRDTFLDSMTPTRLDEVF